MVSASSRIAAADALSALTVKAASSSKETNSFAQQLTGAIRGDISRSLNGAPVTSETSSTTRQDSGASQLPAAAGSAASEFAADTAAGDIPTMLGMGPAAGTPPVTSGLAGTMAESTALLSTAGITVTAAKVPVPDPKTTSPAPVAPAPTETEADAYWAQQPAAVQVLRGMPDDDAKEKLALSLANQGYSIDTQIMVWNWDPQMTMQVRENQGYSWVPSFGQNNIPIGPGLSMPGVPNSYSPNSPPPGSIAVSTAFAVGTIQNPLVQVDQITT